MLCGTLAGIEMGLALANIPHTAAGVQGAMNHLGADPASGTDSVTRAA
jgi:alanine-glyoxylate transaminase/serine-glyoxylate transaminase/serine-pyruvate transaminase